MKNQQKVRVFSFIAVFSLLLALVGSPLKHAEAAVAAVTLDGTVTTKTSTTGTTVSWSHTTGTGSDQLLLVGVSWNSGTTATTITSVTFTPSGGSATTLSPVITRQNSWAYRYSAIYSLVNPPSGTAGTIAITLSSSVTNGVVAGAANFSGVDQTTPLQPAKGTEGVSASSNVTLTGLVGDELVFDNLMVGGTPTGATAGSGQTPLTGWNITAQQARGAASTKPATTSTTMTWTPAGTQTSWVWEDTAVAINPTCTGTRYTLTVGNDGNGSVALNPAGGSYCSGRTVMLTPAPNTGYLFNSWSGTSSGDVVNTGGVYTIVMNGDKSVTANFATPSCQDVYLNADDDTYISGAATTTNYGNATTLQVDGSTTAATQRTTLLRWNVGSIPANASITNASIILNVTDTSTIAYPLYDVAKPWVEGNGTAGSGATWANYTGTTAWGTAGASTTTGNIDRGTLNLWSSSTSSFNTAGTSTVVLSADGLNVVRRWVTGGSNNGVMIQQYSGSTNTLQFDSTEGTTPPQLKVNYCLGSAPNFTLTAGNDGNGSVTLNPAGGSYASGTTVTLTPVPNSGYVFSNWSGTNSGDIIDTGGVYTIVMNASKTVQANFTPVSYTLTANNDGNGTVTLAPTGGTYASGTTVTLTPVPNSGYIFDSWTGADSGDVINTGGVYTIVMDADKTVQANFVTAYTLTVTKSGDGSGTVTSTPAGIDCGTTCSFVFAEGTSVTLNATAATGSTFNGYQGVCSGTTCTVTMNGNRTVDAMFSINRYALNLTFAGAAGAGGTVNASPGGLSCNTTCVLNFDYPTPVSLTATPALGAMFVGWGGDCSGTGTCNVTMTDVHNVTATFSFPRDLTMAVSPSGGGSTSPAAGAHTYPQDTVVPISAEAAAGYHFVNWSGSGVADPNAASTTVTMDASKTVTANFALDEYTLDVITFGDGNVGKTPLQSTYNYNDVVQLTATGDPGWGFHHWSGDLTGTTNPANITMTGDKVVTAVFARILLDGAVTSTTADDVSFVSFSHTTGSGTNRLMLIGISWNSGTGAVAINSGGVGFTYNGGADSITCAEVITKDNSPTNYRYSAIYSCPNPPASTSGTLTITFAATIPNGIVAGVANFAGVDPADPLGTPASAASGSTQNTTPTVTLTGLGGTELVFDNIFQGATDVNQTLTAGADQVQLWTGFAGNTRAAASTEQATGSSVTMSSTAASNAYWVITAVPINPATAPVLPGAFGKTSPTHAATGVATSGSLTWGASSGATSYDVCLSSTNALCDTFTSVGDVTTYSYSGLANNTRYYWQVRAVNADGNTLADGGAIWYFDTVVAAPAAFNKTSPTNAATGVATNPTLSWGTSGGGSAVMAVGTTYEYCYATTTGCTGWTSVGANTSVALSGLSNNQQYFWQVRAVNEGGNTQADSGTYWSFTTVAASHTVTFNANGGTGTMTPQVANVPTALTLNAFTRGGYNFAGWNTVAGGGGTAYGNGAIYDFAADITLYAQWSTLPNHTVTFNANGGTGTMTPQVANVPTALTTNTFTWAGYNFAGWNTVAGGGGTAYANGATYDFAADITLYAQWTALPNHTVTFNANGGTGTMSPQVANVPTALALNTFTRAGYNFAGWNTAAGGGGTAYANGATYDFAADITLYAQWTADVLSHKIPLVVGWNLVSLKVHPADTDIADVLASISGKYDLVYAWDAATQSWLKYAPGVGFGDSLTNLDETFGFWINVTAAGTLDVSGTAPTSTAHSLKTGWNLVGFPADTNQILPDAFSTNGVGTDFSLVYTYRPNDTADHWKMFDRTAPAWVNDLNEMDAGLGYWVKLSADHTWTVDY